MADNVHVIYSEISCQFPQLVECGGFELLRVSDEGGKHLDIIVLPENGYTTTFLRGVVHHAKMYIRPLQKDLLLEPIKEEISSYTEYLCNI